jgi:hypothetical protein
MRAGTRVQEDIGHMSDDKDVERDMAWLSGRSQSLDGRGCAVFVAAVRSASVPITSVP